MTKQELMENYTMEQLTEMVVDLQKENLVKLLKSKNREDTSDRENVFDAMQLTITELCNAIEDLKEEKENLKSQLRRKETEINQIDDILEKLFGVTHDIAKTLDEFEKELRLKIKQSANIKDFPEQPIEVANTIINAWKTSWDYKEFSISELYQIAEHLLVYCNANEGEGNE